MKQEEIEQVLRDATPLQAVRRLAETALASGVSKEQLLSELDRERLRLRDEGRERDEDLLADVMDFVIGWCSPHMRLDADKRHMAIDGNGTTSDRSNPANR